MADTMKMEYKIFLEAEDVSQSRILSCASYMKRVLESCNNPYISRAELDDESDLDDFVLRLFVEEEIEEKECTNPAMAELYRGYGGACDRDCRGTFVSGSGGKLFCHMEGNDERICLCFPRR